MKKRTLALLSLMLVFALGLCACSSQTETPKQDNANEPEQTAPADEPDASDDEALAAEADALRIGAMKGPTSIGLASMMEQEEGDFTVVGAADELTPLLLQDELDIALVPANVAAVLYQRTDGQIRVIDVNTLGVLYGVSLDASISSIEDLRGRTVYMTGQGSVPEYTFAALLAAAGMGFDDLTVEFCSEATEVAAQVNQHADAVGILPQPYATAITVQNPDVATVLDLTEEWAEVTGGEAGDLITGVTVAKASTVDEKKDVIDEFLERHAASVTVANDDPAAVAPVIAELGIIDNEKIAEKAIPLCNVVCLTGNPMQEALSGYLEKLYEQNPEALGGELPGADFYYTAQ